MSFSRKDYMMRFLADMGVSIRVVEWLRITCHGGW